MADFVDQVNAIFCLLLWGFHLFPVDPFSHILVGVVSILILPFFLTNWFFSTEVKCYLFLIFNSDCVELIQIVLLGFILVQDKIMTPGFNNWHTLLTDLHIILLAYTWFWTVLYIHIYAHVFPYSFIKVFKMILFHIILYCLFDH